jgi:hypothetical protein
MKMPRSDVKLNNADHSHVVSSSSSSSAGPLLSCVCLHKLNIIVPQDEPALKLHEPAKTDPRVKPASVEQAATKQEPTIKVGADEKQPISEADQTTSSDDLIPPPALFKPIKYSPLHIFVSPLRVSYTFCNSPT